MNPAQENYEIARNMFANGNEIQAVRLFEKAADQGCADAQFAMGRLYEIGYIGTAGLDDTGESFTLTDEHYQESISYFTKAAEQGHSDALYALGAIYDYGKGVEIDYNKAMSYYKKASDLNNPMAQYSLGCLYANGNGINQNLKEGVRLFEAALRNAPSEAKEYLKYEYDMDDKMAHIALDLVNIYGQGAPGIPSDIDKTNKYLELAGELGDPIGVLAVLQEYGDRLNNAMNTTKYVTGMDNGRISARVRFLDLEIPIGKRVYEILAVSTERQNGEIANQVTFYRDKKTKKKIRVTDTNLSMNSSENIDAAIKFLKIAVKYVAEDEGVPSRMRGVFD